jgi:hypothetical protein
VRIHAHAASIGGGEPLARFRKGEQLQVDRVPVLPDDRSTVLKRSLGATFASDTTLMGALLDPLHQAHVVLIGDARAAGILKGRTAEAQRHRGAHSHHAKKPPRLAPGGFHLVRRFNA